MNMINYIKKLFQTKSSKEIIYEIDILRDKSEYLNAKNYLKSNNFKPHHDDTKNWDIHKFIKLIQNQYNINDNLNILDAGSGSKPVLLENLRKLNKNFQLYAVDRIFKNEKRFIENNINFSIQDMSETNFENKKFDFIFSLSVIEHGVILESFFKEMSRILKKNSYLLITTDYWPEKIDTSDKFPYDKKFGPMKIFSKNEIKNIINLAKKYNFEILGENTLDEKLFNKVCRWERMDEEYTFIYLPFKLNDNI
tara:strand:- start:172 stop:927 length:756 start_codon:yes stop_codon:yes gene_type:complete